MALVAVFRKFCANFTLANARNGCKKALVPMLFAQNMSSSSQSSQMITKNLELQRCPESQQSGAISDERPLAVILSWLMAKKQHLAKFGDFYMRQGFDVLTISITPIQLMWPVTGTQVVAEDVLRFLSRGSGSCYRPLVIHGFSVGGYVYGEVLVKMKARSNEFGQIADRIVGQVFDSIVDYDGIAHGMPRALTPNPILQKAMEAYLRFHMKTFEKAATQHYIRSSDHFHDNHVSSPALFLFSRDDPVGTAEGNLRVIQHWEGLGMPVYAKCWDSSPHVSHLRRHPDEYIEELGAFLERIGLLNAPLALKQQQSSKL